MARRGHRLEYEGRVNRVIDHVRDHLVEELSLERLARIAAFSPYHFHRIFRALTGEALAAFVQRLRLERAATALIDHPDASVLEIALDHGFSGAATFARAFRARFGTSATGWRAGGARRWRKGGKANRNPGKAAGPGARHARAVDVRIRELPRYRIAYMRYVGPFGPDGIPALWKRFRAWLEPQGLHGPGRITLGIGRDDPRVTAPGQCRYDACVVVPEAFAGDQRVNLAEVPGGRYAVAEFRGGPHQIEAAWDALYRGWLPGSGYEPDDRPCLEVYRGDPSIGGRGFRCELCVPVRPL